MKKSLLLCFSICMIGFYACDKDNDENPNPNPNPNPNQNDLIGKWYPYSVDANGINEIFQYDSCGKDYVIFNTNNSLKIGAFDNCVEASVNGTYDIKGNILTLIVDGTTVKGNYSLSQNTLTLTSTRDYDNDGDTEVVIETWKKLNI